MPRRIFPGEVKVELPLHRNQLSDFSRLCDDGMLDISVIKDLINIIRSAEYIKLSKVTSNMQY